MSGKYGIQQCPFNKAHLVPDKSFLTHLIRCQRNYKGSKVPCPYKATEFFYPDELVDHVKTCKYSPDYLPTGEQHGAFPPTLFFHENLPSDDDWD